MVAEAAMTPMKRLAGSRKASHGIRSVALEQRKDYGIEVECQNISFAKCGELFDR
jgi:hypothetical protein